MSTVRDLLLEAADHCDKTGLHKGDYWPEAWECPYVEGEPACAVGHIIIASGGGERIGEYGLSEVELVAVRHLMAHLNVDAVGPWSDAPDRTAAEVSAALRATAASAAAVPRGDAA